MEHILVRMQRTVSRRGFGRLGATTAGVFGMTSILGKQATAGPARLDISLDAGWLFAGPLANQAEESSYTGGFTEIDLPHSVANQSWRNWDPASWEARWLYRRIFDLPGQSRGWRFLLRFEGALTATTPIVNGHSLPNHLGGYLPFEYEITDYLRERDNRLDVVLDGRFGYDVPPDRPGEPSNSVDFWQLAGLYRGVTLRVVPQCYLSDVFARPRHVLDPAARRLDVECTVDVPEGVLDTVRGAAARLELRLLDGKRLVARSSVPVALDSSGANKVSGGLTDLGDVELWSTGNPKRYQLVATLRVAGADVHDSRVMVGFRQAEFTSRGFFLNGRRLRLFGLNRHQFYPYVGGAMPARVQRRDVRILRDLNCNMVRCSHYPQDPAFLDACDELGLLVFEEAPGWGYLGDEVWRERVVRDVRQMIVRDRNHPSIVLWGVRLNETPGDAELYTRTRRLAKELDGSRQTTGAVISDDYATDDFHQDVFACNDYGSQIISDGTRQPKLKPPRTEWPYLVSEAVGTLSGPAMFYRRIDPVVDQQGQAVAHGLVHDQAAADPRYCGALCWAGFDYPSGNGNQFEGVKYPGVIDQFRVPKLGAAIYASQVDPKHRVVIEPAFYWDFTGDHSVTTLGANALICANADRLELFLDDRPFATLSPDTSRFGQLDYPPFVADFRDVTGTGKPELRVEAYVGGRHLGSRRFSGDHSTDRLSLVADDRRLRADGSDATRVVFRAVDAHGAPRPSTQGSVRFQLSGPATLIGDNPFPLGETGGVAAIWIRSRRRYTGDAVLVAEHTSLGSARVTISVGTGSEGGNA